VSTGPYYGWSDQAKQYAQSGMANPQTFKTGGRVKRTGLAKVHKSEYILPASVKPTKSQMSKVNALKRKK
jgi:hypothetical protein